MISSTCFSWFSSLIILYDLRVSSERNTSNDFLKWWPTQQYGVNDISVVGGSTKLTIGRLNSSQFTRAAVYHVLAYYIYPRLSSFDPDGDAFREKMMYYKEKFNEEFDLILREGVHYDLDSSGTFADSEKQTFYQGRLIR